MNRDAELPPAYYASFGSRPSAWADWWVLLHPPYTLWHLSYVAIGAALAPELDERRLVATLLAFFLAVGLGAHALDELQGRPLRTAIPTPALVAVATLGIGGAAALGVAGLGDVGPGLLVFIGLGVAVNLAYNLELVGGRFHTDLTFAAAWGAFPVLTAFYAQAETLRVEAVMAAFAAFWLSAAQRALSTPARTLRRKVSDVTGTVSHLDGSSEELTAPSLLAPLETALRAMSYGVVALAVALVVHRTR